MFRCPSLLVAGLLLPLSGCLDPVLTEPARRPPQSWPGEDQRPAIEAPSISALGLPPLSLWADRQTPAVLAAERGPFAVGNGRSFALLGLTSPVHTLHGATGPDYSRGARFYGDHHFEVEVDGQPVQWEQEWVARPRGTGLVLTRADSAWASLYTLDFAPVPAAGWSESPPGLIRLIAVVNRDEDPHQVRLRLDSRHPFLERADGLVAEEADDGRLLGIGGFEADLEPFFDGGYGLELGTLEPGAERAHWLLLPSGLDEDQLTATAAALRARAPTEWLDDTLADWAGFQARGLQLETDDPRVNDLYEGLRSAIRLQTSAHGGVAPMSRYTRVWMRDTIGSTRFLLRSGLLEEARAGLDYLHACHAAAGDFVNSCRSDLDPATVTAFPDWGSLPPFSGRTAAEGPSYVALALTDLMRWSGDPAHLEARWGWARRALLAQQLGPRGEQPFSGDETFRLAMGAALGFPLEYPWEELAWSANSSYLLAEAAPRLARFAAERGWDEDAAALEERAAAAEQALAEVFLTESGHHASFLLHTEGPNSPAGLLEERPFEDIQLKPLWLDPDPFAPDALVDLEALLTRAGRGDGTIQSPIDEDYQEVLGREIEDGVATGMVPGFTLWNLTASGHGEAEDAFNALARYAGPSGQFAEGILYDDFSALQVLYDASGSLGDIAARFRPWEGGIVGDALLWYLLGAVPLEDGLRLRPHLPNDQRNLSARGLRAGIAAGDLVLSDDGLARFDATFTSTASQAFSLEMELPVPAGVALESVVVTGPTRWSATALPHGEQLVVFDPVFAQPGQELRWSMSWE